MIDLFFSYPGCLREDFTTVKMRVTDLMLQTNFSNGARCLRIRFRFRLETPLRCHIRTKALLHS